MLRNYLTSAFRNLRRHKGSALINIFGLSVGIACFLLVVLYLQHELGFDTYHEKGDRIYRLTSYDGFNEKQWRDGIAGSDPVPEVRSSYTDVEDGVSYQVCGTGRIQLGGEWYTDIRAICTESNLFNIFSFDLLRGDPATVLDVPNTAVITESLALRLFGQEDPIGKMLPFPLASEEEREEDRNIEITGLMADIPPNTHFSGDLLISRESMKTTGICLDCGGQSMYLLLKEEADAADIAARILTFVRDTRGKESIEDIGLQPLSEIHFSELYAERQGDIRYVYLLSAIALVLLLIACANYMNLATARALRRTREVGVRKVMGAHRAQLVRQFLTETLLLTLLALPVALAILWVALPFFNDLAEAGVQPDWGENGLLYAAMLALLILVGLLAGSYPALFLSGFRNERGYPIWLRGTGGTLVG